MNKIVAFGDSVLKGVILSNSRYKVSSKRFTNTLSETLPMDIVNKAHMGHTILNCDSCMEKSSDLLSSQDYQTVVLEYGGNDCDFDWKSVCENPSATHPSNTPLEQFQQTYFNCIKKLKKLGKRVYLLSLPPVDGVKYCQWLCQRYSDKALYEFLHHDPSFLTHLHEAYNLAVFQVGTASNTPVLDISTPLLTQHSYSSFLCADGIHPNEDGHTLIADTLCAFVQSLP